MAVCWLAPLPRVRSLSFFQTCFSLFKLGCITEVHGGCVEIANVFLGSKKEPEQGNLDDVVGTREEATPAQQQRLRQSLRSFLEACGEALQVNAEKFVSSSGEEAFQKNLVDCYEELSATLEVRVVLLEMFSG